MVLVAAIGAGVLIETAGLLQSKSQKTGEQNADETTNRLQVLSTSAQLKQSYDITDNNVVVENDGNVVTGEVVDSDGVQANVVTNDGRNVVVDTGSNVEADDAENIVSTDGDNIEESSSINGEIIADGGGPGYSVELGSGDNIITYGGGGGTEYNVETSGGTNVIADSDATFDDNEGLGGNEINEISLIVGKAPGAGDIQLDDVTIQYLASHGQTTLVKEGTAGAGSSDTFTVTTIRSDSSDDVLMGSGDRLQINIALSGNSGDVLRPLQAGETVELQLATSSGSTTSEVIEVDDSLESGRRLE